MSINKIVAIKKILEEILKDIEKKSIDINLLSKLNNTLKNIIKIVALDHKNEQIVIVLESLVIKIDTIDLDDVKLDAFEYLGYIIFDLNKFLSDYFIEHTHQDEYIIRDSFSNNIDFFFDKLYDIQKENSGSLDFF